MGRGDEDKALVAAGIFGLMIAALVAFFVWLVGEQKKQARQRQLDYRSGKDIQDAIGAIQHLETLRQAHLQELESLAQAQRDELARLDGQPGRGHLLVSYRERLGHLDRLISRQKNLLVRTWMTRMTQQMHARLAVAMRVKPDLSRLSKITEKTPAASTTQMYVEAQQGLQEVIKRLGDTVRENQASMQENVDVCGDQIIEAAQEVGRVCAQVNARAQTLCEELGVRVDELRSLQFASKHRDLQTQAAQLDGTRVSGSVVIAAADDTLEELDRLNDWILQEMATMEVEMACAAQESAQASVGLDLQDESRAAQEVSRQLAHVRQAHRRATS